MAKKIGAIVSLSLIGILIIATIIMANVNVKYSVNCTEPSKVIVSYGSKQPKDAQGYSDDIVNYINNASKEKALTALFNGNLGKKAQLKLASTVGKTITISSSSFYVRYRYNNPQTLMDGNKKYKASNETVLYDDLVFEVKELEGNNVFNVYVIPNAENANVYTYYYELEAEFEGLFDFLTEKGFNN